jgi:hypothetical protein
MSDLKWEHQSDGKQSALDNNNNSNSNVFFFTS